MPDGQHKVLLVAGGLLLIAFTMVAVRLGANQPLYTDSSVIYGGRIETEYPFAGYLVNYRSNGRMVVCGTAYLSPTLSISAAHCVDYDDATLYGGNGEFNSDRNYNFLATESDIKPGWDQRTSSNDLAVVRYAATTEAAEYAEIAAPNLGCNYVVVGYGRTEPGSELGSSERLRKSADMCITRIDNNLVYLTGSGGGICFGDSGSPLFEKDTNKLVGVISAITSDNANPPECAVDNQAIAVRVDSNSDFILDGVDPSSFVKDGDGGGSQANFTASEGFWSSDEFKSAVSVGLAVGVAAMMLAMLKVVGKWNEKHEIIRE